VADGMIGANHRPNAELLAQGLANMVSPLFGGLPATGAIARTATNIKNGARTPVAGITHALTLLVIYLVAMPLVRFVPIASLAGILIVVAWNMSEVRAFLRVFKVNRYEVLVLLTTFLLTVFADLSLAIITGFVLSLLLFMKRMSDSVNLTPLVFTKNGEETIFNDELGEISDRIIIFEVDGPLFFGSVAEFVNIEKHLGKPHRVVILRLRYVPILDTTGLNRLGEIVRELQHRGIRLIVSGANDKVRGKILNLGILEDRYVRQDIREALGEADRVLAEETSGRQ